MADSVKNPEPDFIAGKFADIDYTGVEHQILAFDTFQQTLHFRRFVQIMGFHLGRPYLNRITQPKCGFVHNSYAVFTMLRPQLRQVVCDQVQQPLTLLHQIQLRHITL